MSNEQSTVEITTDNIHRNWLTEVVFMSQLKMYINITFDVLKKFIEASRKNGEDIVVKPIELWVMRIAFDKAMKSFPGKVIQKITLIKIMNRRSD